MIVAFVFYLIVCVASGKVIQNTFQSGPTEPNTDFQITTINSPIMVNYPFICFIRTPESNQT